MKRFLALILCILTVVFAGCNVPSEQMAEEDIRKQIIADNSSLNAPDDEAGAAWLRSYLNVENAEMVDIFRSADMSEGFELCFSKWTSGQREYIVSEVVYGDGKRYLCDLYELTGVMKLHTLSYAYERISSDERFSDGMRGIGSNPHSDGITEVNITSEASQVINNTLLVNESIREGQILYGIPSDGDNYTVRVVATVDGEGIRNVYMCNDERPAVDEGHYLLNKTYYVHFSEESGDLVLLNRQYEETLLCETVDANDETRRIPAIYGVYNDRYAVYTVSDNTGVISVGIYDAQTRTNTVRPSGGVPVGMYGDRLYLYREGADGTCTVAYIPLYDPNADAVLFDVLAGTIENAAFSEDGRMAVIYAPEGGRIDVAVFDAANGEILAQEFIEGIYCDPKYAGFLEDGSLMVLCDKKLLCDEYLFIIGE